MDAPNKRHKGASRRSAQAALARIMRDQRAATAIEYGFILALVVLAMFAALTGVANVTTSMWSNINDKVTNPH